MTDFLAQAAVRLGVALRADVNALEIALLAAAAVCLRMARLRLPWWWLPVEDALRRFAERPGKAVAAVILTALAVRLALLPLVPVPHPGGADEFSHSLVGDTLAHGRLTNPPHPKWVHFETRHVLQQPTYASMYLPGQGAFLALGRKLFGHPWAGVLISTTMLAGAVTWLLQGWFSPGWALAGGLLVVARIGVVSYWINGYWGGSVPALGGALVLGAYPRLRHRPRAADGLLLGCGLGLLAASRPFEGLAFAAPVALALGFLVWTGKCRPGPVLAAVPVLAVVLVLLGLYFRAVTGSATLTPYQVNQRTYGWPMTLAWQDPPRPEHRHKELRDYYNWERAEHERLKSPAAAAVALLDKSVLLWSFYFGPALTAPLILAFGSLADRRLRLPLVAGAATLAATLVEQSSYPHYVSPATCVALALVIHALARLDNSKESSRLVVRLVLAIVLAALVFRLAAAPLGVPLRGPQVQMSWCCSAYRPNDRWPHEQRLRATEGQHLVLVRYGPSTRNRLEWVYNEADIDGSRIVWARDMGEAANRELIRYYPGRRVWVAEPDAEPPAVRPY
jgi:hypothetical protein